MKLYQAGLLFACMVAPRVGVAGGLLLPGAGAASTSRAGAAVASADDGEALVLNPAGLAKATGNTVTISAALIDYAMQFQRRGTYDAVADQSYAYAGQPYALVKNASSPSLGIGSFQPIPVIAFATDFGNKAAGLHLGAGIYAPNAYPFRDLCTALAAGCQKYVFNNDAGAPPSARYDIMKQEAAIFLPSLALAYRVNPDLDIGARFSAGRASLKSTTALWATPGANYEEDVAKDGTIAIDASDGFVPGWGLGATFRPTAELEFGFNYSSELEIHAKGSSIAQLGPTAANFIPGIPITIGPTPDPQTACATGGTAAVQKACVDFALPRTAQLGGRYKLLDGAGRLRADLELDLDWEQWGKSCSEADLASGSCTSPSEFRVISDSTAYINGAAAIPLNPSVVRHGLRNTYGARLGGSYHVRVGPVGPQAASDELIVRGGIGYDTAAAKQGWLRSDFDGAARTTLAIGAAYRTDWVEVSLGGGAVLEGSPSNPNVGGGAAPCNPTVDNPSCGVTERQGPDPINPLATADKQLENPVAQGDYRSHYLMILLGATAWF
jgi:long-subunit fatty acid transport protein